MAKKDAAFDKFLADVLATVPDDKRAGIEEVFNTDGVKTQLRAGVLAREDYSRSMDELTASRTELAAKIAEANAAHAANVTWYADANREYAATTQKLSTYEQTYGALDGSQRPVKNYLTKEELQGELDKMLTPRDGQALDVAIMLAEFTGDYREQFKEKLNTRELIKFATENRLPLDSAYERYVAPKVKELDKKAFDEAVAQARIEGGQEALSKHNLPALSSPSEIYSIDAPADVPRDRTARINAAVASMHSAASLGR